MHEAQRGELDAALRGVDRASREYAAKNTYWFWRFRVLKAHILVVRGSSAEALQLLSMGLPPSYATTDVAVRLKLAQGLAYERSQKLEDSEKSIDDAVRLATQYQPGLLGDSLSARGYLKVDEMNYAAAEADFHKALSIARQQNAPSVESSALGNLGFVAMKQEHYDESIDWDREALRFSQSQGQQGSIPNILGNLGWSYSEMGDFDNALDYYKQAEETASRAGLIGSRVYWLNNIGDVYYQQHDYASAESTIQEALNLARKQDSKSTITQCLNDLSQVALETGRIPQAEQYNKEASTIENEGQDSLGVLYSTVAAGRIEAAKRNLAQAEQLFQKVIDDPKAETSLRWEAEARLAKTFADAGAPAKADAEYRLAIDTIESARSTVKSEDFRLSFLSSAISFYSDYIDFLVSRGRTQDALEVAELSRTHALAGSLGDNSSKLSIPIKGLQPAQIAGRLNAVILSYWLGPRKSYLWAITPKRVSLFELPPAAEIDSLVRSYRGDLVGPRDVLATQNASGRKLYDLLVAPAGSLIPKGARVMILPDGSLYDLNFETLLAPAPQLHYWIDDVIVANGNSLVLLAASANKKLANSRKLLLIGDPVSPSADFPDLPQAPAEMAQIEKYFAPSNRTILSKAQATPDAYLDSRPGQFSYIHFVAHGTSSRTSPLDSAVILTREGDSYKLYARDVMKRRLSADLVTISACHGAGGRTYSGEGLVGLTWAFLRAGAHGVVAALWEVNDSSTSEMMNKLYDEMSKGTPPDVALRDSKLSFLHSNTVYRKPFYWAAFQIYRGS
jgi:CHAT domain-containing protein/Tfp pilus assembly protein PilF